MEKVIELRDTDEARALFGSADRNLKALKKGCEVDLVARNGRLSIRGDDARVQRAAKIVERLRKQVRMGHPVTPETVERMVGEGGEGSGDLNSSRVDAVRARTPGQKRYLAGIVKHDIVFCSGPAGTGKTFLAVVSAVSALKLGKVKKIVLVRPAVEAGEKLGFLPGDFEAKISPYLRPLYDALYEVMNYDQVRRSIEREVIEIVPLAYMRGRTLNRAFIILDEGQNTTKEQMKMFLTRMGDGSKIVVTGDTTQVDLPSGKQSGMIAVRKVLRGIGEIAFVQLHRADIVRHPLVSEIVRAYEEMGK